MKKIYTLISLIIIICTVFAFTSCGQNTKQNETEPVTTETEPFATETETDENTETTEVQTDDITTDETTTDVDGTTTPSDETTGNQFSLETQEVTTASDETESGTEQSETEVDAKLKDALKSLNVKTKNNYSLICFREEENEKGIYSVLTFVNNSDSSASQKTAYRFYEKREEFVNAAESAGVSTDDEFGKHNLIVISSEIDEYIGDPTENFDVIMGGYTVYYG